MAINRRINKQDIWTVVQIFKRNLVDQSSEKFIGLDAGNLRRQGVPEQQIVGTSASFFTPYYESDGAYTNIASAAPLEVLADQLLQEWTDYILTSADLIQIYVVDSQLEQLALYSTSGVKRGDLCMRTDISASYVALNRSASAMDDWQIFPQWYHDDRYYTQEQIDAMFSSSGTGGSFTFRGLWDTPSSYNSQGGKGVRVNTAETGLEFYEITSAASTSSVSAFTQLSDTPSNYSGEGGKGVRVNTGENALEFYVLSAGTTDEKVAVDSGATPGYLGATSADGVLRTSDPMTYNDGGDYVTLGVDKSKINLSDLGTSAHTHVEADITDLTHYTTADWNTDFGNASLSGIGTSAHMHSTSDIIGYSDSWTSVSGNYYTKTSADNTFAPIVHTHIFSAFTGLSDTPSSYSGQTGKGLRVNGGETGLEFYTPVTDTDEKVAVVSSATAGYLGNTSADGVLRTAEPLTYNDGGDYITIGLNKSGINLSDLGSSAHTHSASDITQNGTPYYIPRYDISGTQFEDSSISTNAAGNVCIGGITYTDILTIVDGNYQGTVYVTQQNSATYDTQNTCTYRQQIYNETPAMKSAMELNSRLNFNTPGNENSTVWINVLAGGSPLNILQLEYSSAKALITASSYLNISSIDNLIAASNAYLVSDSGEVKYKTAAQVLSDIGAASVSAVVSGTGTINYIPKWNSSTGLTDSNAYDSGSKFIFEEPIGVVSTVQPQIQLIYTSGSRFANLGVDSTGLLTFSAAGTNPRFKFENNIGIGVTPSNTHQIYTRGASAPQLKFEYDINNFFTVSISSLGFITFDAQGAGTTGFQFSDPLTLTSVANATSNTNKFLVLDSNIVKYRTSAEMLSDIGAASVTALSGEANTASNQGGANELFIQKTGDDLEFRTLSAGPGVSIISGTNVLTFSADVSASEIAGTPNYYARFNGTGDNVEDSMLVDDGSQTLSAYAKIVFPYGIINAKTSDSWFDIFQNTEDGSDTKATRIGGGGDVSSNRGAYIALYGNERATLSGDLQLVPGTAGNIKMEGIDAGDDSYTGILIIDSTTVQRRSTTQLASDIEGSIDHTALSNLNSSSYYHLTSANHNTLTNGLLADSLHHHDGLWESDNGQQKVYVTSNGWVGIGANGIQNAQLYVYRNYINATTSYGIYEDTEINITEDGTYYNIGIYTDPTTIISAGVTDSGYLIGTRTYALRNSSADNGTLNTLYGLEMAYGHYTGAGTSAQTNTAYGIYIRPFQDAGNITTRYGLAIDTPTGSNVENEWGIYVADDAPNYFAGTIKINTIDSASADYDKILVSNGGIIEYRTGAEVLSDIGAAHTSALYTSADWYTEFGNASLSQIGTSAHTHVEADITDLTHYTSANFYNDLGTASLSDLGSSAHNHVKSEITDFGNYVSATALTGTQYRIPRFATTSTLENSPIYTDSNNNAVGINVNAQWTSSYHWYLNVETDMDVPSDDTLYVIGQSVSDGSISIPSSATNSGYLMGVQSSMLIDDAEFEGTIGSVYGARIDAGTYTSAVSGTIDGVYGIRIRIFKGDNATHNSSYGIYQESDYDSVVNYFEDSIGIGIIPQYSLDVSGTLIRFQRSTKDLYINPNYGDANNYAAIYTKSDENMALRLGATENVNQLVLNTNGNVGVGADPSTQAHFYVADTTLNISADYFPIYFYHVKTDGASDENTDLWGIRNDLRYNQSSGILGNTIVNYNYFSHTNGEIGTSAVARYLYGLDYKASLLGGIIHGGVQGTRGEIDQGSGHIIESDVRAIGAIVYGGGQIDSHVYGVRAEARLEATGSWGGTAYGAYNYVNLDGGTVGGNVVGTKSYVNQVSGNDVNNNIFGSDVELHLSGTSVDVYGHRDVISVLDNCNISDDVYGKYTRINLESGSTVDGVFGNYIFLNQDGGTINTNAYALWVEADMDGTVGSTTLGRFYANSNIDYGVTVRGDIGTHFQLEYDGSNYMNIKMAFNGATTFDAVGNGAIFNFLDPLFIDSGIYVGGENAFPSSAYDSYAVILRTAGAGLAPFDQAGSLVYRPRLSNTAGRSNHYFYTGATPSLRFEIEEDGDIDIYGDSGQYVWFDSGYESVGIGIAAQSDTSLDVYRNVATSVTRGYASEAKVELNTGADVSDKIAAFRGILVLNDGVVNDDAYIYWGNFDHNSSATIVGDAYLSFLKASLDADIGGDFYGSYIDIDQGAGTVSGNATGLYVRTDFDGNISGTTRLGYFYGNSNTDIGLEIRGAMNEASSLRISRSDSDYGDLYCSSDGNLFMYSTGGYNGAGNTSFTPAAPWHVHKVTSATSAVQELLRLRADSAGVATSGFGAAIAFHLDSPAYADDFQTGRIENVMTSVSGTAYSMYFKVWNAPNFDTALSLYNPQGGVTQSYGSVGIKSTPQGQAIHIERYGGSDSWQLGVDTGVFTAGDFNFSQNGTDRIIFKKSGSLQLNTISAATTDTDKFLVSDSGIVKFRTGAEVLSDIGAQASDDDLTALAGLTGTGFAVRTGTNTWNQRTLQTSGDAIGITYADGVASNPVFFLDIGGGSTQVASGDHNHNSTYANISHTHSFLYDNGVGTKFANAITIPTSAEIELVGSSALNIPSMQGGAGGNPINGILIINTTNPTGASGWYGMIKCHGNSNNNEIWIDGGGLAISDTALKLCVYNKYAGSYPTNYNTIYIKNNTGLSVTLTLMWIGVIF